MSTKPHAARRVSSALAAAALAGGILFTPASMTVLPQAQAQSCDETHRAVSAGSLNWGVKESFRNYVEGRIANGKITVTHDASRSGGSIQYPASASSITSNTAGLIRFGGTVNFKGHDGLLDLTFSDIALRINGRSADLTVDYSSREFKGQNATTPGPVKTGNDVVLAKVALNSAPNFSASSVNLAGTTTLTQSGVEAFGGFYEAGSSLDNTAGVLSLTDECGPAPVDTGGTTGGGGDTNFTGATDSGATEGVPGLVGVLNDTLIEVNGLIVNSGNIIDNSGRLYDRVSGGSGTNSGASNSTSNTGNSTSGGNSGGGSGASTGNNSGGGTSGGGKATSGGTSGGASGGTSGGASGGTSAGRSGGAAAGGSGGGSADGTCQSGDSIGVISAEADWGIRSSFRNYISGSIANGGWQLSGVEERGDTFIFSGDAGAVDTSTNSGTILFPGTIRFYGHDGTLDTTFSNMEIQFSGNSGQLLVNAESNDVEGNPKDYGRIVLANLSFSSLDVSDSAASGTAATTLTAAGSDAFGSFYPEGDSLDDISFTSSLGGAASCAEGQGSGGSAAGSGGGAASAAALRSSGGSGDGSSASTKGSVNDKLKLGDVDTSADGDNSGNPFKIKGASVDGVSGISNSTLLLLLLAGFVVAGTTLTSFGRKNPNQ